MDMLKEIKIPIPTDEEIAAGQAQWLDHHAPNCISNWFPKLVETGVSVPRTEIVRLDEDLTIWAYGEPPARLPEYVEQIAQACDRIGYPCFLRSGLTSAKHSWKDACHVPNREAVHSHVYEIVEYSAMADFAGLPVNVFAARELLPTEPAFTAFRGRMPITREFRFFVDDGEVEHWQPYWPPAALEDQNPSDPDWREKLALISRLEEHEFEPLYRLSEMVGKHFGAFWSIDWLWVPSRGWYCTDMALGEQSYRWEPEETE